MKKHIFGNVQASTKTDRALFWRLGIIYFSILWLLFRNYLRGGSLVGRRNRGSVSYDLPRGCSTLIFCHIIFAACPECCHRRL